MSEGTAAAMQPPAPPRRGSWRLWLLGALAAIVLHGGCIALVVAHASEDDADDADGAPAIEVGLEFTAPHLEPTDLPPGPETVDSVASPAVPEQKAVVEQSELPKDTPTETEDPDRVVTPEETQKEKQDDPKIAAVQTNQSSESVASEATAPPTSDKAIESERSAAPVQGMGESSRQVKMGWEKRVVAYIYRHKRYPAGARKSVVVDVEFTLDRVGHVVAASIVKGSGDPAFDQAALDMLHRSDPVPPPPPLVADERLSYTISIEFHTKEHG